MKKNENDFKIRVTYRGKVYPFDYGSQAYVFHIGIYNDIPKKYGLKGLRDYTELVQPAILMIATGHLLANLPITLLSDGRGYEINIQTKFLLNFIIT